MCDQEHLRQQAVQRYFQDGSTYDIYHDLGKSRGWLYFWVNRYDPKDPDSATAKFHLHAFGRVKCSLA